MEAAGPDEAVVCRWLEVIRHEGLVLEVGTPCVAVVSCGQGSVGVQWEKNEVGDTGERMVSS